MTPDQLKVTLRSPKVVNTMALEIQGGQYVRIVDTGQVIGNTALKFGGEATTWIQVFTNKAGNLITTFPVPAP